ncbi:hypothetical protein [Geobacillus sp. CAMR5420]|uniref:hypothetical protein n=1 Tax=Geobacillus sp. CAMR5420 TaxID=1482739 RepID=UPI00049FC709|nr:hypothetical protein [Geobacillus sp. CAMR5420]KDE46144.1 hypothetical protein DI44_17545 [Geobacillus sp. CAMR5420]
MLTSKVKESLNQKQISKLKFNTQKDCGLIIINRVIILLLSTWMVWPYFNNKIGIIPIFVIIVLWVITTDYRWLFEKWTPDLLLICVWFITFIPYVLTRNFTYGVIDPEYILTCFFLFVFGIFVNHYYMFYKKDFVTLGRIAFISLFMYLVGSIQTYLGLQKFPYASRTLATANHSLQYSYLGMGIGGFGFVYSLVFVTILSLYLLKKNIPRLGNMYKSLYILFIICLLLTIIKASYATALIFTFVGIILVFTIKGLRSLIIGVFLALIFILAIPKESIAEFLVNVAYLFKDNDIVYVKFMDLAETFLGESADSQTANRGHLYLTSLITFIQNPLFGIYGPFGNQDNGQIGGHSGWLDLLAMYGIFGSLPLFLAIILNFRKQLLFYSGHPYYVFLIIAQILFICFGFLNPVTYVYQIGFALFVVAPALPFLPYAFGRNFVNNK